MIDPITFRKYSIGSTFFYFVLIDLLFFPYFKFILIPISLPVLFIYFLLNGFSVALNLQMKFWLLFLVLVLLSVLHGLFYDYLHVFFFDNLKYFFAFVSVILYYAYFYSRSRVYHLSVVLGILKLYLVFLSFIGFFLLVKPMEVLALISLIYGETASYADSFLDDLRFRFFFQDPNTYAYFLLLIFGFLLYYLQSTLEWIFYSLLIVFNLILTQSSGALVAFSVVMLLVFVDRLYRLSVVQRFIIVSVFLFLIITVFTSVYYFKDENVFINYFYERTFNSSDRASTGGGRFAIWSELSYLVPGPIGIGYNLFIQDLAKVRSPHSDFFGFVFRYGIFSVIPFFYYVYNNFRLNYYILIPALMTFFINSLFDDFKLILMFFLLMSIHRDSELKLDYSRTEIV